MPIVTLTPEEARVLGCLMEKAVTTPDNYPLSLNAVDHRVQPVDESRADRHVRRGDGRARARLAAREGADPAGARRPVSGSSSIATSSTRRCSSRSPGVDAARRAAAARRADAGRAQAAHRTLALVPVARRRRGRRSRGSPTREFVRRLERRPGPEGSAVDAAPRAGRRRRAAPDGRPRARRVGAGVAAAPSRAEPAEAVAGARAASRSRSRTRSRSATRRPASSCASVAVTEDGRDRAEGRRAPGGAQPAWAARPYDERAARAARVPRSARSRGRGVRADHDERGGQADPAVAQRGPRGARAHRLEHRARRRRRSRRATSRAPTRSRSASRTSRSVSSRTSARGTTRTSSGSTRSFPRCSSATRCVYKPSEHATLTGLRLVDLMHRSGVPVDVVHAIVGARPDRRRARRRRRRHGVLHRLVRDRAAGRAARRPTG